MDFSRLKLYGLILIIYTLIKNLLAFLKNAVKRTPFNRKSTGDRVVKIITNDFFRDKKIIPRRTCDVKNLTRCNCRVYY